LKIPIIMVPIDKIIPRGNPKVEKVLLEDIRVNGLKEPLRVMFREDGKAIILNGHHRYFCCKELNYKEIPCFDGKIYYPPNSYLDYPKSI